MAQVTFTWQMLKKYSTFHDGYLVEKLLRHELTKESRIKVVELVRNAIDWFYGIYFQDKDKSVGTLKPDDPVFLWRFNTIHAAKLTGQALTAVINIQVPDGADPNAYKKEFVKAWKDFYSDRLKEWKDPEYVIYVE